MNVNSPSGVSVVAEATPNPSSIKFNVNRTLLSGAGQDFPSALAASSSPLAREIFLVSGVTGVYIGGNFVTVSMKEPDTLCLMRPVFQGIIETHVAMGKPVIGEQPAAPMQAQTPASPIEAGIIKVLEDEIRPAVAMDGGDVMFAGYENGIVKLHLRGSCHSCPSALMTLKGGIENRLKQQFPEIVSVEAVM